MNNIPIIGQKTRQQRRDDERQAAKNIGQFMARTMHLFNQMAQDLNLVHMRVNIAFETMRLLGATDEQIKEAADKAEAAVQALEDAKLAQVQERLAEEQLLTQPEDDRGAPFGVGEVTVLPEDDRGFVDVKAEGLEELKEAVEKAQAVN